jgi:hypothetical protein
MNNPIDKKDQVRRRVIELIHGYPYDKAILSEFNRTILNKRGSLENYDEWRENNGEFLGYSITLARLLTAFYSHSVGQDLECYLNMHGDIVMRSKSCRFVVYWRVAYPNGQECTLYDQTEETVNSLHQLFIQDEQ